MIHFIKKQPNQGTLSTGRIYFRQRVEYCNPVGTHECGFIGEEPNGIPNNLMPYMVQVAKGEREYLKIFGNDYPTKDGTGVRDYIHVVDLAKGHIKALERLTENKGLEIYNLGTGRGYSVLEIVETFEIVNQVKISYKFAGRRPGDIAEYYANSSKAYDELGWKAEMGIANMCESAWRYGK